MSNTHNNTPPRWPQALLRWLLKEELAEEVLGDLEENFHKTTRQHSSLRAKLNYWYQALNYLRPFAIKNYRSNSNHFIMYRHNFKVGIRNLLRNRGYSFINIGGLAIGMTAAILIGLWVHDEFSYNTYHEQYNRIARVMITHHNVVDGIQVGTTVPPGLGTYMRETYPDKFEQVAISRSHPEEVIFTTEKGNFNERGHFMQAEGPDIFGLKMISGTRSGLNNVNSVLLSKSLADKLFGSQQALNATIQLNGNTPLTVTGVYQDLPQNSFLHEAAYIAPFELYIKGWSSVDVWDNYFTNVFVTLQPRTSTAEASGLIKDLLLPHLEGPAKRYLSLQPMEQWHLYSSYENGHSVMSERMKFVLIFGLAGIFVLSLAAINFINLTTAQSEKRSKEIGVRKSIGSFRSQLIGQFLVESILTSVGAFIVSCAAVACLLSSFNQLTGKDIALPFDHILFWLSGVGITLLTGLVAGSYPAFHLSSFNPVKSLKGTIKAENATLQRKLMVVFQFSISIILITGAVVVYEQIQHVKNRAVGYEKSNLIMLQKKASELYGKYNALSSELKNGGAAVATGEANYPLTNTLGNNDGFTWEGKDPSFDPSFNTIRVNYDYGQAIGWQIVEGRDFSRDYPGDVGTAVIITESARELIGLDDPVGKVLHFNNEYYGGPTLKIIGVVKDMIKGDPFQKARPAIIFLTEDHLSWMFIRLNPHIPTYEALNRIERTIKGITSSAPFTYRFVDDAYNEKFSTEERIGRLTNLFAVLAIFISCLGLYGLASYMAIRRTKEIGIRKVLGASLSNIWRMLSKDFILLILGSCLVAIPVAYYLLSNWLDQYVYKIELQWWQFVIAGATALIIAILTVSHQTLKAAFTNPVNSLKSE